MLLSSAPPNRSSSIALAVIFLHTVFTKYKAFGILLGIAGALYASIMPHTGSLVKDSFGGDVLSFLPSVSYSFLSDPDQTLYPKIRFGHRHEMDELIFDDHQLTFRAVRSGQITFIFRPGSPSHLARNLLYTFRCHRDRLFLKCLRPKLHHPLRRKCL